MSDPTALVIPSMADGLLVSSRSWTIEVVDVPDKRRFEIQVDGELAGFADYSRRGGRLIFRHTEINTAYEGRGLGSILVVAPSLVSMTRARSA